MYNIIYLVFDCCRCGRRSYPRSNRWPSAWTERKRNRHRVTCAVACSALRPSGYTNLSVWSSGPGKTIAWHRISDGLCPLNRRWSSTKVMVMRYPAIVCGTATGIIIIYSQSTVVARRFSFCKNFWPAHNKTTRSQSQQSHYNIIYTSIQIYRAFSYIILCILNHNIS